MFIHFPKSINLNLRSFTNYDQFTNLSNIYSTRKIIIENIVGKIGKQTHTYIFMVVFWGVFLRYFCSEQSNEIWKIIDSYLKWK
jgi:hypothetical protein